MITTDPPIPTPPNGTKTPIEEAIDATNQLREVLLIGANQLRDLGVKLKGINRDHRDKAKEFHNLRSSLRSLQAMKL